MAAPPVLGSSSEEEDIDETKKVREEQKEKAEEGIEDLFGDDEEEEGDGEVGNEEKGEVEDEENDEVNNDDDEEEEVEAASSESAPSSPAELQRAELTLPRHPRSHSILDDEVLMFNLPRFLSVDPEPFAPSNFEQQLNEFLQKEKAEGEEKAKEATAATGIKDSIQFKKLQLLNTIRWRYAKTSTGELYKQSNAKIIEWEDGTMSLKIGNEYFEIRSNKNEDNILAFQGGQVLVGTVNISKSIKVLPPSTQSIAHKILASTLQNNMKLKKTKKINTIVTRVDPELKARENERALREIEKARRKQVAKIEQEEEKLSRRSRSSTGVTLGGEGDDIDIGDEEEDDDYAYAPRRSGKGGNEDEYENDDFVVGDDEEIEGEGEEEEDELDRAAERLRQVKRAGAEIYKRKDREEDEEKEKEKEKGDDIDDDDAADEDSDEAVVRKKRRVILGDEDEE
ncbi:DEKNAAC101624 [Brettanomyces naardenensis]|uniref:DEKNAAC101624 n=1 Tax=Brettanomyces naardenensis TaxID=13370 RepID=A0A448YIC5_BRENA|nr:DEKNAAC101624 [Brettanomyces naardenensis]